MPSRIREMPEDERPREKLAAHGAAGLADSELLAILLRTGIAGANAIEVARDLLKRHGSLRGLSRCSVDELAKIHGVGLPKPCSWRRRSIWEIAWRAKRWRIKRSIRQNW